MDTLNTKEFVVDWNSMDDLKRMQNILHSRIGELRKNICGNMSKKERIGIQFQSCLNILNSDISTLYDDISLDVTEKYYVYAHCDPRRKIAVGKNGKTTFAATLGLECFPFYIGKGTEGRAFDLNRNESHRKIRQSLKTFNQEIHVKIIRTNLKECDALILESKLIDIFELQSNGGLLINLDEGVKNQERRLMYKDDLKNLSSFYQNSL